MTTWRILVADDEPYVLLAVKHVLQGLPASVLEAPDGEQALRLVKAQRPDLVILDVRMPRMDGFTVAEAMKHDPTTAEIPIIFLSALQEPHVKVRGLVLGAEDFIGKPIEPEELKARVRVVLRRLHPPLDESTMQAGRLQDVGLPSLVRTLEAERRTARLLLTRGEERAELVFVDGHIARAVQGARSAELAVYHLLTWREGSFEIAPHDPASQIGGEVAAPNEGLLLEGLRRLGEIPALWARLTAAKASLDAPVGLRAVVQQHAPPETARLVGLLDGSRDLDQIVLESPYDAWTTLKILHRLVALGALESGTAGGESRGGPRIKVEFPIEYHKVQPVQEVASFNLSAWGVFVRTAVPMEPGEQVYLRFRLSEKEAPVAVMGQVVWRNLDPAKWGGAGMGIRFLDLSAADREVIEQHLARQVATQLGGVMEHP